MNSCSNSTNKSNMCCWAFGFQVLETQLMFLHFVTAASFSFQLLQCPSGYKNTDIRDVQNYYRLSQSTFTLLQQSLILLILTAHGSKSTGHQLCWPSNSSIVLKAVSRRPHFSDTLTLLCCWITSVLTALARLTGLFITLLKSQLHSLCSTW